MPQSKTRQFQRAAFLVIIGLLLIFGFVACTAQKPVSDQVLPGTTNAPGANLEPGTIEKFAEFMVGFLIVLSLVSLITRQLKIPYTIGLVLAGLLAALLGQGFLRPISPEVILILLLPPLIFESVVRVNILELRRAAVPVMILAVPGVILTTLLVGGALTISASLPLSYALVFGALIAPTDPVSVLGLFRSIGAPKRLLAVFEGESLLNDGTAIVLFKLMLIVALTGQMNVQDAVLKFLLVAGGGILVGASVGVVFSFVLNRIDHYIVETTLTIALAYGAYLTGEFFFGVSGVLSVVAAGLMVSYLSKPKQSPTTKIFISDFWEYAAFIANSLIFLMIGMQTKFQLLIQNATWIFWSILAVLIARILVVWMLRLFRHSSHPFSWSILLFWGGLRGAVSLALALSLSYDLQYRDQIQAMTFGVVLFSLLVQGSTLSPLIHRLGLVKYSHSRLHYEQQHARMTSLRSAARRLEALHDEGLIPLHVMESLLPIVNARIDQVQQQEKELFAAESPLRQEALADAWNESLRTQRSTLVNLFQSNVISEEVYGQMVGEIDAMLADKEKNWPEIQEILSSTNAEQKSEDES